MKRLIILLQVSLVFNGAYVFADEKTNEAENKHQAVMSSLPENVKLIIGYGKTQNYYIRGRAIHQLPKNLPQDQIDAFYKFLYDRLEKQELKDLEFNGLKNELVLALMAQDAKPEALAGHLVNMYNDKTFDPTWRDYCVQFFGKWYEKAPHNESRKQMLESLFEATGEVEGTIGGTAVTMLRHMVHLPEVDKEKVSALSFKVLSDPRCSESSKIATLQVCAELRNRDALPVARKLAQNNEGSRILRMSAIAAVGFLGDKTDIAWLEPLSKSSDIRLRSPAQGAIKRIGAKK
ncbi:MAG: hypothetical protein JXR78_16730 [Victivallales bacterium]|nr:hypothetical protein [Victivallales bacterium]